MNPSALHGIYVPILTPLTADEAIDHASLRRALDFLVEGGVHGIWILGTTGEFAAFSPAERARAVETTVDQVRGRVPVVANVSDCSTGLAIQHARNAVAAGADAIAATPPYYYPHSQDELLVHFRELKAAVPDVPSLVYNIPSTVKVKVNPATTVQLAREDAVQGIKDSANDLHTFRALLLGLQEAGVSEERFRAFIGTRTLIDSGLAMGAIGAIPAISNIAPAPCVQVYEAAMRGDCAAARQAQDLVIQYENLWSVVRGGSDNAGSLGMMKRVLADWGVIANPTLTRPLRPLADAEVEALRERLSGIPGVRQPAGVP